ncbi:MAG: ABC transporter permease [Candidatus Aminicenantes bacterium]|jgi:ABC-2 type transport system permease protein
MKRLRAVIIKEFAHILRDPTSLTIIFLMPLLMMFIFGYSINYDLENIEAGVIDFSSGEISQKLIDRFANNRYFVIEDLQEKYPTSDPLKEGERLLKSGDLKEVIVIPADFSRKIKNRMKTDVGIIIDGSDSNVANLLYQYNEMILLDFLSDFQNLEQVVKVKTKILFNPEVKSSFFFIPGIIAILLVMISAILTSISISREKESGSIDLIFISPLRSPEIIIGKTIPYIFVALVAEGLILFFAHFWFGVPFRGNLLVLLVFSLLYIITGLSMGILISAVVPSQKAAMFAALLSTLLPSIMLSGFIFPLDSLAPILQWISHLVPATYFLKIIRGVVVKGSEIKHFVTEGLALVIFSFVLLSIASIKFARNRKRAI